MKSKLIKYASKVKDNEAFLIFFGIVLIWFAAILHLFNDVNLFNVVMVVLTSANVVLFYLIFRLDTKKKKRKFEE